MTHLRLNVHDKIAYLSLPFGLVKTLESEVLRKNFSQSFFCLLLNERLVEDSPTDMSLHRLSMCVLISCNGTCRSQIGQLTISNRLFIQSIDKSCVA